VKYGSSSSLSRIILNADGTDVIPQSKKVIPMNIGFDGLDVAQAPNGNLIELRYGIREIAYFQPKQAATTQLIVTSIYPRRGGISGGTTLSIYGVNLDSNGPDPLVMIGNVECPRTSVSMTRIDCTLPGGFGMMDITVTNGAMTYTFSKGYRYISGSLPTDFKLPVYK
jgi:IPT/TIG domain